MVDIWGWHCEEDKETQAEGAIFSRSRREGRGGQIGGLHGRWGGTGQDMLLWTETGQRGGIGTALQEVMARNTHQRDWRPEQWSWDEMDTAQRKGLSIQCPIFSVE